ncbi:MAG: sensor histidine kinase [Caldilineaceae bacterium]|nr:sensor histidine kinase [Caldilineaceae bacterium]
MFTPRQSITEQVAVLAVAEERKRLARELHDSLGHVLTISMVQLENAAQLLDQEPRQAQKIIRSVRGHLASGLDDLRVILGAVQTGSIDSDNLLPSLQQVADQFADATGIALHSRLPAALPPLSDAQARALYRTAQEALTNIFKHALALNVWIDLHVLDGELALEIRDDGQGFNSTGNSGYGLQGMRERAAELDGTIRVSRPPDGGMLLSMHLPLGGVNYA